MTRAGSYGESRQPTVVDRFGVWLSSRRMRASIGDAAGKRIADVGCGFHATLTRGYADICRELALVDLTLAEDLAAHPNVTAVAGRLPEALERLPSGAYDVAVCNSVLEHLDEPALALGHIRRLLVPGGLALINVPSWRGKWFLEFSAYRLGLSPAEEIDDHKAYYDPKDLWPLLVGAGFPPRHIVCATHKFGLNTFAVCRAGNVGDAQAP